MFISCDTCDQECGLSSGNWLAIQSKLHSCGVPSLECGLKSERTQAPECDLSNCDKCPLNYRYLVMRPVL